MEVESGIEILYGKLIIIVMGSNLVMLLGVEFDGDLIGDSIIVFLYNVLFVELVVIGVGYIGFEFGLVWNCFGSKVIVFEVLDCILLGMDVEIVKIVKWIFEK